MFYGRTGLALAIAVWPIWVATGGDFETARQDCAPAHGFGGGTTWLTQFGTQGIPYDQDYACPVA